MKAAKELIDRLQTEKDKETRQVLKHALDEILLQEIQVHRLAKALDRARTDLIVART